MSVNMTLAGLSQTASSNGPDGGVDPPSTIDDAIRYALSFIASLRDGKGFATPVTLASASTTDIGSKNSLFVEVSGTTTITSLGTNYNGPRFVRFTGALILTHNATTLNLLGAANITTAAGDLAVFHPNLASDGWNMASFQRASALYAKSGANSDITSLTGLTTPLSTAQGGTGQATAMPFTKSYTSAAQTITLGGPLTLAHGLGGMPTLVQIRLICINAGGAGGYSLNDEIIFNSHGDIDGAANRGFAVVPDATNVFIRISTNGFYLVNKSTGAQYAFTASDWNLIVWAWK